MDSVDDLCALIQGTIDVSPATGGEPVEPETPLLVSGLLDSLMIMRIVAQVERRTGIAFPETSVVAANFRTPAALWAAIEEIRSDRGQERPA